jgi:hypothetical protein
MSLNGVEGMPGIADQRERGREAGEEVRFEAKGQAGLYEWVSRTLREHGYKRLSGRGKGLVKLPFLFFSSSSIGPEPSSRST